MVVACQNGLNADIDYQLKTFRLQASLSISGRGVTAVFGRSGSGKSTLLRLLAGLSKSEHSEISFQGKIWQNNNHFLPPQQRHIGFVFQQPQLFPHLSVADNIRYAYRRRFNPKGPELEELSQWLDLEPLWHKHPQQLSGGQQQRVAIARALASHPDMLFMDEPLSALDNTSREEILGYLERLHRLLTIPMLYVSHNIEEIQRLADQVIFMQQGKAVQQGPLLELANQLDSPLQGEQYSTLVHAIVSGYDKQWQLTTVDLDDGQQIQLSGHAGTIEQPLRLRIPARDVSISLQINASCSIINCLQATIIDIQHCDDASTLVQMRIGQQQTLLAQLTRKSVHLLQLAKGNHVIAQIKGVAMLTDQPSSQR